MFESPDHSLVGLETEWTTVVFDSLLSLSTFGGGLILAHRGFGFTGGRKLSSAFGVLPIDVLNSRGR